MVVILIAADFFGIVIKGVGKYCFVYIQSIYRLC